MQHDFDYVIIGAGMAGEAAAQALREADGKAGIGMLGAESHPPYDRPPLSKALWKDGKEADIWRPIDKARATVTLQRSATQIDRAAHVVHDDKGDTWKYRKLLIATGGTPRRLPGGDGFIYYRTFDDYRRLRAATKPGAHIAVIGGGFIGSEIAAAMAMNDCKVTMLFPDATIGARVYPKGLADSVTAYYREKGVDVRAGARVEGGSADGKGARLKLADGGTLVADAVVAGLGITPNVQLAEAAGLKVENGIVVNEHLQTSDPDIYAAGDVAAFPAPALGRRMRVEHENAANTMGARAGKCMAGQDAPYDELPFFYSDLFDLGYEAVGTLDARLETVEQWVTPFREGVVYYLEAGRVRGVLLWNTWDQVAAARKLIAEAGPFNAGNVRGRLPVSA
ncbi:MAG TPA: FAD-dependent oxidoreductase [Rhodanobacteraceae bacterium]|jgi:NADPH-dependent 2,4-dienoyl-CoA reductase/sulfur reductase-like enzyme|nr:FAD-dependent oxidoreductase [Rhodanobacteraceae bacterium]